MKFKIFLSLLIILSIGLSAAPDTVSAKLDALTLMVEQVDLSDFPTVTLRLSAWGPDGLPPTSISPAELSISENGGTAIPVDQVGLDTDSQVSVALVMDISGSMQGPPLVDAQQAAARFLDRLKPGRDQAALIAFADVVSTDPLNIDVTREIGFTTEFKPAVYDRVEGLQAGGYTHLYQALTKAVKMATTLDAGHRAILLLSDGKNEPAEIGDPNEPIQLAREAGIPIFVIGLGGEVDEAYLQRVAAETGGLYQAAPTSAELADLFEKIAGLLKTQYTVQYTSQLAGQGQDYTIELALNQNSGSGSVKVALGSLPVTAQNPTESNAAVQPSPEVDTAPTIAPTPDNTDTEDDEINLGWLAIAGGLALIGLIAALMFLRRKRPIEACAKCGHIFTPQETGACPVCSETRRLPKP